MPPAPEQRVWGLGLGFGVYGLGFSAKDLGVPKIAGTFLGILIMRTTATVVFIGFPPILGNYRLFMVI